MNILTIALLVGGLVFLLFQIFISTGGKAKFKSDLPKKKRGKDK